MIVKGNLKNGTTVEAELDNTTVQQIFREVEHEYRLMDARAHFLEWLRIEKCDKEQLDEKQVIIDDFNFNHQITYDEIVQENSTVLNEIVEEFENNFDCNLDENSVFTNAVENVLRRYAK